MSCHLSSFNKSVVPNASLRAQRRLLENPFYLSEYLRGERVDELESPHVLLNLLEPRGARDHGADIRILQAPGQRELRQRRAHGGRQPRSAAAVRGELGLVGAPSDEPLVVVTVAYLAWQRFKKGDVVEEGQLVPVYVRKSDAQIHLNAKKLS